MKSNIFKKQYIAVLDGILGNKYGTISAHIARKDGSIIERCIDKNGDTAITHYTVQEYLNDATVVLYTLETGRTHQLRVHSKFIGHSIIGDTLYGNPSPLLSRQALHAYKIEFIHPITKENLEFIADIPKDIQQLIDNNKRTLF